MDNRLIFLYSSCFLISGGGTKQESLSLAMKLPGANSKAVFAGKSAKTMLRNDADSVFKTEEWVLFSFREKLRHEFPFGNGKQLEPYRKPKQVGWARSLRLSGEGTLRNSAN